LWRWELIGSVPLPLRNHNRPAERGEVEHGAAVAEGAGEHGAAAAAVGLGVIGLAAVAQGAGSAQRLWYGMLVAALCWTVAWALATG